jgi:protein-S-isoprenylcysteine O-methyltransferase Ste14|tara:strand:- start:279 stop:578 length:300 start_codon:yes stop_codon:yes gene_type:complete
MKNNKLKRQVKAWSWIGKVLPLSTLFAIVLILVFDFQTALEWTIGSIAIAFGIVAFTWWWWVIYAVKELNQLLSTTTERFEQVMKDIRELKDDFRKNRK